MCIVYIYTQYTCIKINSEVPFFNQGHLQYGIRMDWIDPTCSTNDGGRSKSVRRNALAGILEAMQKETCWILYSLLPVTLFFLHMMGLLPPDVWVTCRTTPARTHDAGSPSVEFDLVAVLLGKFLAVRVW